MENVHIAQKLKKYIRAYQSNLSLDEVFKDAYPFSEEGVCFKARGTTAITDNSDSGFELDLSLDIQTIERLGVKSLILMFFFFKFKCMKMYYQYVRFDIMPLVLRQVFKIYSN